MAAALTALLRSLTISDSNHEDVLKACNEALKEDKNNIDAQHARVVALLKLDRYEDALRQLETSGPALIQHAQIEYAYTLYKEGRLEEASSEAEKVRSRGGRHVEAQALYRQEDFSSAHGIYTGLQDGSESAQDEENDLRINTGATEAQLEWQRKGELVTKKKATREDLEAYETAFNAACCAIARGELPQAELLLKQAEKLCRATKDISDEDQKSDLLLIGVQQLYVSVLLGKTESAQSIAEGLESDISNSTSSSKIAQINKNFFVKSSLNPFLASRILNASPALPRSDQFFGYQTSIIRQNNFALDFLSGKYAGIASSTARQLRDQSVSSTSPVANAASAANAAAQAQLQLGKGGVKSILPLLHKRPYDVGLISTIVQLCIMAKNHGAAIKLMHSFCSHLEESKSSEDLNVRFCPGVVAINVALYTNEHQSLRANVELAKAASHWSQKAKLQPGLMKAAGHSLLRSEVPEDLEKSKSIFTRLSELPPDRFLQAGSVASGASTNAELLPSLDKLIGGLDVDALDSQGIPRPASTATLLSRKREAEDHKRAKKRVRKSRLPKDHDPNKKVDPERWLPMRDRSYYKPKGKKKGRHLAQGGAQGAIATDSDAAPAQSTPVQSGSAGGKSKKKKNKK